MEDSVVRSALNILGSLYESLKEDRHHLKAPAEISRPLSATPVLAHEDRRFPRRRRIRELFPDRGMPIKTQ